MGVSMGIPSRSRDLLTAFTHLCATCSASQASAFSSYSSSSSISSACAFYSTRACCQALDRGATLDRFAPCSWLSRTQIVPNIHEREMLGMSHSFATDAKKAKKRQKVAGATEINAGEGRSDGDKFSERDAALQSAISHITSQFGKESVLWLGRNTDLKNVPVISSGSLTLDVALGVGGLPKTFGSQVIVKIAKNKLAPPFKTAEFELEFGKGISKEAEVLDLSVKYGFLQKSGNWYVYSGENIANGKENAKKYLREHEELFNALTVSLKDLLMVHSSSSEETDAQELLKVDADEKNQEEDGQMEMSRTVPM